MDNGASGQEPVRLSLMSRLTVDPAELTAAAAVGERLARSAHGVAGSVAGTVAPDPGRADGEVLIGQVLSRLAGATRALARLADQDARTLRTAAVRYAAVERRAGGGAPCR